MSAIPPEHDHLERVRAFLRGPDEAVERAIDVPAEVITDFLRFTSRQRLSGWIHRRLRESGVEAALPPEARAEARSFFLRQWTRNEALVRVLEEIADLLADVPDAWTSFKGPLFAERYYGDLDARPISDLDVLAADGGALREIRRRLRHAGFANVLGSALARASTHPFVHHEEVRRGAISVELHWTMHRHPAVAIDVGDLWRTRERRTRGVRSIPVLSDEYELLAQIVGIWADLQTGTLRLRSYVDVAYVLEAVGSRLDWSAFFERRGREGTRRASAWILADVLAVLDCGNRHPVLAAHLRHEPSVSRFEHSDRRALSSRRTRLGDKWLGMRLYEIDIFSAVAWWMLSLPFRTLAYGEWRHRT